MFMATPFRVYFNRKKEPGSLVWSVDDGDQATEINVREINTDVPLSSGFDVSREWPDPSGWFHGCGYVYVVDDIANIFAMLPAGAERWEDKPLWQ